MLKRAARLVILVMVGLGALVAVPAGAWAQTGYPPAPTPTAVERPAADIDRPSVAAGRPVAAGRLSFTGAHHLYGLSELAAGLAVGGAVLVYVTRRRRDVHQQR